MSRSRKFRRTRYSTMGSSSPFTPRVHSLSAGNIGPTSLVFLYLFCPSFANDETLVPLVLLHLSAFSSSYIASPSYFSFTISILHPMISILLYPSICTRSQPSSKHSFRSSHILPRTLTVSFPSVFFLARPFLAGRYLPPAAHPTAVSRR